MGIDLAHFDWQYFILRMAVLIIAITIHEFAHAITADKFGDPTPRRQGRISLFPIDHLDPVGTIMMVISSITGVGSDAIIDCEGRVARADNSSTEAPISFPGLCP